MDSGDMILRPSFGCVSVSGRTTGIVMTLESFVQHNEELQVARPRFPASRRMTAFL